MLQTCTSSPSSQQVGPPTAIFFSGAKNICPCTSEAGTRLRNETNFFIWNPKPTAAQQANGMQSLHFGCMLRPC
ncbi:hypothetical protein D3C77_686240 [compost metagenome]